MADKRISQLNSHTSPTGSDLLVIVNNNETKKITYADLIDGIAVDNTAINNFTQSIDNRVDNLESWSSSLDSTFATDLQVSIISSSVAATIGIISQNTGLVTTASFNEYTASQSTGSLVDRLNSIETATSSYELKGSGILSGSISYNDLTNIPSGIVSESTDLSSLNTFTQSIDDRVDSLESWSSSLDDTFATDLQVSIVSSSVAATIGIISQNTGLVSTSSFNQYTASISTASLVSRLDDLESHTGSYLTSLNGTISGSSQLTGSYDERYVLSGSITQTTWDNISGKPTGLVSESVDISSLNAFTASYFTDSSSFDGRITTEKGRIDAILSASTADVDTFAEIVTLINSVDTTNDNAFATYYTSSNARISSLESVTSSYETIGRGIVSGSSQLTSSLATTGSNTFIGTETISGSLLLSGSFSYNGTPLQNGFAFAQPRLSKILNNVSYTGATAWDASYSGSGGAIIVTGNASGFRSSQGTGTFHLYRDGVSVASHSFYFNQTNVHTALPTLTYVSNSETGSHTYQLYFSNILVDTQDYGTITVLEYGNSAMFPTTIISGSSQLTSSFDTRYTLSGSVQPLPNGLISGSSQLTSSYDTRYTLSGSVQPLPSGLFSSSAQLPSGIISGSSQLTASYDTRYTLSGSVSSTPAGTISGSSQLTSSFDGRYVQTGSFNAFTASAVTTGSNSFSGSQTITGSLIVSSVAVVNGAVTIPTGSTISLTSGSNLFVDSSGAITGSLTGSVFGIGDVSAFSSSVNTRLNNITSSAIPAGTISGSSQLTSSFDTRYLTIGGDNVISGSTQLTSSFEVRGSGIYSSSAQLPAGIISGSSQLTSSYDLRYSLSGSGGGTIPAGTISGSSQLTASYDGRYIQTGSFNSFTASINTYTASINTWTSSIATTGSNTFNGNQTITGSLNLTNGNIVASQITANTASLYLTSGSNLYIQNTGIAEISGSLLVSGSTTFTGSISISSGSITMPNRPAFRVTGAGGATTAVTTLSGSMTTIDFNQANCWDNTTGTFTAPIAGLYQVNLVCRTNSNASTSGQIIVYKNNTGGTTGTPQVMIEWAANTTMNHAGGSTISKLAVGDTLKAVVAVGTLSFDGNDNFSVAYIG